MLAPIFARASTASEKMQVQVGVPDFPFGRTLCGHVYQDRSTNTKQCRGRSSIPARANLCRNVYVAGGIGRGRAREAVDAMRCQISAAFNASDNARRPSDGGSGSDEGMMQRWRVAQGTTTKMPGQSHGVEQHVPRHTDMCSICGSHSLARNHLRSSRCKNHGDEVIGIFVVNDGDVGTATKPLHPPCSTARRSRRGAERRRLEKADEPTARASIDDDMTWYDECDDETGKGTEEDSLCRECEGRVGGAICSLVSH
jgi:hypothetical protein